NRRKGIVKPVGTLASALEEGEDLWKQDEGDASVPTRRMWKQDEGDASVPMRRMWKQDEGDASVPTRRMWKQDEGDASVPTPLSTTPAPTGTEGLLELTGTFRD